MPLQYFGLKRIEINMAKSHQTFNNLRWMKGLQESEKCHYCGTVMRL